MVHDSWFMVHGSWLMINDYFYGTERIQEELEEGQ